LDIIVRKHAACRIIRSYVYIITSSQLTNIYIFAMQSYGLFSVPQTPPPIKFPSIFIIFYPSSVKNSYFWQLDIAMGCFGRADRQKHGKPHFAF